MAEMYPGPRPGEYVVMVSKEAFEDLQRAAARGDRLPNETFSEYVRRNPRPGTKDVV